MIMYFEQFLGNSRNYPPNWSGFTIPPKFIPSFIHMLFKGLRHQACPGNSAQAFCKASSKNKGSGHMKIRAIAAIAALTLAAAACAPTVTSRDASGGTERLSFAQSANIAAVGARLSALRAQNGLTRPLGHSAALQAAAQAHADDMARTGNFGHNGSGGSTLTTRTRAANYSACFAAENIAYGQGSVQQVFTDWMASRGHRRNILAAQATQYGFASAGRYYVLVLGRSC